MHLEPGEPYEIEYGNGHSLSVVALSARQKKKLVSILQAVQSLDTKQIDSLSTLYDLAEEGLKICSPGITDEQIEKMDEQQQMEVIGKTLAGALPTAGEQKKSESPHSCDAASCVSHAGVSATT